MHLLGRNLTVGNDARKCECGGRSGAYEWKDSFCAFEEVCAASVVVVHVNDCKSSAVGTEAAC